MKTKFPNSTVNQIDGANKSSRAMSAAKPTNKEAKRNISVEAELVPPRFEST